MAAAIMSAQLRRNIILIDVNSWILNGSMSTTVFQNAEGANQQRVEEVFYCRCAAEETTYVADSDSEHEGPRATQHCTCDWRNDATIYASLFTSLSLYLSLSLYPSFGACLPCPEVFFHHRHVCWPSILSLLAATCAFTVLKTTTGTLYATGGRMATTMAWIGSA